MVNGKRSLMRVIGRGEWEDLDNLMLMFDQKVDRRWVFHDGLIDDLDRRILKV